MSFATRSMAAAILVLAACHDASAPVDPGAAPDLRSSRNRPPEHVDGAMGITRSVMYGVNGTNTVEVLAIDVAGNRSARATTIVEVP
jgi:hypothetical protein